MGRTWHYSDELEKGIELLFFQPDTDKYDEGLELIQKACSRKEPDAFYTMSRCHFWEHEAFQKYGTHYYDYIRDGIQAGSHLCVLGAGEFGLVQNVSEILPNSPQISVFKTKEMALEGNLLAQLALGSFYMENGIEKYINSGSYFTYDYPEKNNPDFLTHLRVNSAYEGVKWLLRAAGQGCLPAIEKVYEIYLSGSVVSAGSMSGQGTENAFIYAEKMSETFNLRSKFCRNVSDGYRLMGNQIKRDEWMQKAAEYFRLAEET